MFWNRDNREQRKLAKQKKQEIYDRVYQLHENASFLCYINDAYKEEYEGEACMKLEGWMVSGKGTIDEKYYLYGCDGNLKAELDIDEFYVGTNSVNELEVSDGQVAIYPKQQEIRYKAGDILCKLEKVNE